MVLSYLNQYLHLSHSIFLVVCFDLNSLWLWLWLHDIRRTKNKTIAKKIISFFICCLLCSRLFVCCYFCSLLLLSKATATSAGHWPGRSVDGGGGGCYIHRVQSVYNAMQWCTNSSSPTNTISTWCIINISWITRAIERERERFIVVHSTIPDHTTAAPSIFGQVK